MKTQRTNKLAVIAVALMIAITGLATACQPVAERPAEDKIGVIVSILPLADFVENIGGERVDVTVMVPPGVNYHAFAPTPRQLREVSRAQMFVKVGSGLEFERVWMDRIRAKNEEMLIVDCSVGVELKAPEGYCCCAAPGGLDPHIWVSPRNARIMAKNIYEGLIQIDPQGADFYRENLETFLRELDALDAYIRQLFEGFANRYFLVFHPAFGYFARDYNLNQLAIEREGKEPTPRVIMDSIRLAREHNLSYIFVSPQFPVRHAETIAREIGTQTVVIDHLTLYFIPGIRDIANALVREME
jgi:zinc transport system substrate-binding protein